MPSLATAAVRKTQVARHKLKSLFDGVDRVDVTRLADERQSRDDEIKLRRDIALQLIAKAAGWW